MANNSSILAWRIPWTGKPGRLQSIGSKRVGHTDATEHAHRQEYYKKRGLSLPVFPCIFLPLSDIALKIKDGLILTLCLESASSFLLLPK